MASKRRSEAAPLAEYRRKRRFDETPEPAGTTPSTAAAAGPRFVVQKHAASHLHYDFRLEEGGVLRSWAIPKGPSMRPRERRLAMQVEDHPLDYFDFEGEIPEDNYGAGEVIVWDWGTWEALGGSIDSGKLKLRLDGEKLRGIFDLIRTKGLGGRKNNAWLLLKAKDEDADPDWSIEACPASVKTGRTMGAIHERKAKATRRRARRDPVPEVKHPELATLIDAPFDDDAWLFEVKWDGFRALATIGEDGTVALASRNGKDLLARFPELGGIAKGFTKLPVVVDGEIVALDGAGRSSFQRLQNRMSHGGERVRFVVFDALYAGGRDLRGEPLTKRKEILASIVKPRSTSIVYSTHVVGTGTALFDEAQRHGLEGVIGKRAASTYQERRTRDWVKVKAQLVQECVIGGFTDPAGGRQGFGALVLGVYDRGKLVYVGNVGTGFDAKLLRSLRRRLEALAVDECPFATRPKTRVRAHWVKPVLVAQIRFTEWTDDGSMRHPAFLGLREDKPAKSVRREHAHPHEEVA
jgi:bifunctional non-homologous end joining protein LigD